jgi:Na+-translocating ferredoxin:NAD+ oxidoreductase subunit G
MADEHVTKQYSILQIALNLTAACFISGAVIATTYFFTAPIAVQKAAAMKAATMKALVKDADNFKAVDGKTDWFAASKSGKTIAYVVPAETKGFGGTIDLLVAVTTDGKVIRYEILSANETPGLGDNASKEPFKQEFVGKGSENLVVTKDPSDTKDIQAMTGATITSKAVTKGVKEAVDEVVQFVGGKK